MNRKKRNGMQFPTTFTKNDRDESLYLSDKERPFPHGVDESFDEESLDAMKHECCSSQLSPLTYNVIISIQIT